MANIASMLKQEISRIARKELRSEIGAMKRTLSSNRSEIAALKRRALALEQQVKRLTRNVPRPPVSSAGDDDDDKMRFSAKGLVSQRKRLGLSADAMGKLLGASGQSVYNWEQGRARPRKSHLPAIAALRTLGKKAAATHLATLGSPAS